ncbi:MAG: hypothetical protein JXA20_20415 [Spirochaetes bacterium]|nr:hypothetical protein [Spirochaetota bacterium]
MGEHDRLSQYAKASLILGIIGMLVWLFPFLGFPVSIVGLVLGLRSFELPGKGIPIAGIVLCVISLTFSSVNGGIGCYLGSTGQHNFMNSIIDQLTGGVPQRGMAVPAEIQTSETGRQP